jgi:hypothetical protein
MRVDFYRGLTNLMFGPLCYMCGMEKKSDSVKNLLGMHYKNFLY